MKKFSILALTLVLTAALFVGCGCTNRNAGSTVPTTVPTTMPTIAPTEAPTVPTTRDTQPSTRETYDNGNGLPEDPTIGTTNAAGEATDDANGAVEGRARGVVPNAGR